MTRAPRPWPPSNYGGHYNRPNLHIWRWLMVPPAIRAATYYGIAACATSILAGIKVWQAITEPDDETGD